MVNQFKLSHAHTYDIIDYNYLSLFEGGGCPCDNCGKLITNMVTVACGDGKKYVIGTDCAKTLSGLNKDLLKQTETHIGAIKRFYKKLSDLVKYGWNVVIKEDADSYQLFTYSDTDFMNRPTGGYYKFHGQTISKIKAHLPTIEKYLK